MSSMPFSISCGLSLTSVTIVIDYGFGQRKASTSSGALAQGSALAVLDQDGLV